MQDNKNHIIFDFANPAFSEEVKPAAPLLRRLRHRRRRPPCSTRMCVRGGRFVEAVNYLAEMMEFGLVPLSRNFDMVTDGLKYCRKHDLARRIERLEVSLRGN